MSGTRKTINYVDTAGVHHKGIVVVNQAGVNRWLAKIGVAAFLNSNNELIDDYDLLETTNEFRLGPDLQQPPPGKCFLAFFSFLVIRIVLR